jgi:hypothetical protein
MHYHCKYGKTRLDRAIRMASNNGPVGERQPRYEMYEYHDFTNKNRCSYLSEIVDNMVYCRSQKWRQVRKIYTIHVQPRGELFTFTNCSCLDKEPRCKHILCCDIVYNKKRFSGVTGIVRSYLRLRL